jgi:hypothetical protein
MKEVEMFNNGVGDHPLCPLNHSSVEGGGSTTATPTQKHERLNTLTYEEGLQQAQLHISIPFEEGCVWHNQPSTTDVVFLIINKLRCT